MSPASSGSLEVERYIGACLISSQHTRNKNQAQKNYYNHHQHQQQQQPQQQQQQRSDLYNGNYITYRPNTNSDGWAGGMPLISFANHQQRRTTTTTTRRLATTGNEEASAAAAASRCASPRDLAVHTQGLPLILAGRNGHQYHDNHNRRLKTNPSSRKVLTFNHQTHHYMHHQGRGVPKKISECKDNHLHNNNNNNNASAGAGGGVDTLSVASDESSGSNNSETSLPRIIKPRKRRKKDRKPHPSLHHHASGRTVLDANTINNNNNKYYSEFSEKFINVTNIISTSSDHNDSPQLHHRFEDVLANLEIELDDDKELSNCQCRYCDPDGQIWDVDKHCYSPFLTVPPLRKQLSTDSSSSYCSDSSSSTSTSSRLSSALQSQCFISTSTFSLDLEDAADTAVAIAGKLSSCSLSNLSGEQHQHDVLCTPNNNNNNRTQQQQQQCLEISTQIVTSPNGHRDLEIRLFSSEKLHKFTKDSEANLSPEE